MRALVLGGTGPTGPFIVEGLFKRGYDVTILHSGQHEVTFSRPVEDIHGDVHFEETLVEALGPRTFDLVVAAYGRLKVVAKVMVGRTRRVVSIGGAGAALFDDPPTMTVSYAPGRNRSALGGAWDHFSRLMWEAEQSILEYHHAGHYNVTHLRYPLLYGPRQLASTDWCIVRRILDGRKHLIVGEGGLKMESRAYVENAAHAMLLAIDNPEVGSGKVYNVTDNRLLTLKQRAALMANALDHDWTYISMPYELAKPFHPFARGKEHRLLDNTKIRTELGYRDVVDPEAAVAHSAKWLAENRPEPGGELETQLNDPFDYKSEDAIIAALAKGVEAAAAIPFKSYIPTHPYRHPKKPNETWQVPDTLGGVSLRLSPRQQMASRNSCGLAYSTSAKQFGPRSAEA